jgi:ABC-type uncharacterized transport system fused permease/ATPase subunit
MEKKMSDLNDLIHTNAAIAFNQGAQREQERIIKLLNEIKATWKKTNTFNYPSELEHLVELIKAEQ